MSGENIAIFASGKGSNAEKIISFFKGHPLIQVALIVTNKSTAGVLKLAADHGIPSCIITKEQFYQTESFLVELAGNDITHIVLAGFLWKIPDYLIREFPDKIINIHPALLPNYGGKGMYGHHVHRAVFENKDKESGITIHLVNEHYDEGQILYQERCEIQEGDSPDVIAEKVLILEHHFFPRIIEKWIEVKA